MLQDALQTLVVTCAVGLTPAPPGLHLDVGTGGQEGGAGAVLALLGGADLGVVTLAIHLKQETQQSQLCQTGKPVRR